MEVLQDLVKVPIVLALAVLLAWVLIRTLPLRPNRPGFRYVHVNEDRSVRELDVDEETYLNTEFDGADGGRPYIKSHFWSKAPDGRVSGYLRRAQVPWWIEINEKH